MRITVHGTWMGCAAADAAGAVAAAAGAAVSERTRPRVASAMLKADLESKHRVVARRSIVTDTARWDRVTESIQRLPGLLDANRWCRHDLIAAQSLCT